MSFSPSHQLVTDSQLAVKFLSIYYKLGLIAVLAP